MIVRLPKTLSSAQGATDDGMLGRLRAYWNHQRGQGAVPRADGLYLSDLAAEIPNVLMCFRDGTAFRVEFAGSDAQDLLGFDPTGELLSVKDPAPILVGVAKGGGKAAKNRRPELTRGIGWTAIELPFVEQGGVVSVLLIGLAAATLQPSAEILPFTRSKT